MVQTELPEAAPLCKARRTGEGSHAAAAHLTTTVRTGFYLRHVEVGEGSDTCGHAGVEKGGEAITVHAISYRVSTNSRPTPTQHRCRLVREVLG